MSLKAMYNKFADTYDYADLFGAITKSHNIAIEQIKDSQLVRKSNLNILDLGVGNGLFLKRLQTYFPNASFTGIDVSGKMLNIAKSNLSKLNTVETSAAHASNFLPHHTQDLVLAHFINAYIPIHTLFTQAKLLTKANGYFSLITTTYDSFPVAQKTLADFISRDTLLSKITGHYYKSVVKNTTVAASEEELLQNFHKYGFTVVEHTRLTIPIKIKDIEQLAKFGIEGTWFLNTLAIKILPRNILISRLKKFFNKMFTFPYEDVHVVDIVLGKK